MTTLSRPSSDFEILTISSRSAGAATLATSLLEHEKNAVSVKRSRSAGSTLPAGVIPNKKWNLPPPCFAFVLRVGAGGLEKVIFHR
jgi:hypothetical protein